MYTVFKPVLIRFNLALFPVVQTLISIISVQEVLDSISIREFRRVTILRSTWLKSCSAFLLNTSLGSFNFLIFPYCASQLFFSCRYSRRVSFKSLFASIPSCVASCKSAVIFPFSLETFEISVSASSTLLIAFSKKVSLGWGNEKKIFLSSKSCVISECTAVTTNVLFMSAWFSLNVKSKCTLMKDVFYIFSEIASWIFCKYIITVLKSIYYSKNIPFSALMHDYRYRKRFANTRRTSMERTS